ncbi:MAG: RNA polymerase sigma factor [Lachnospiraceae bacterium]|jgi:RNA polymerase sigma factor, sigma-70 family|nr:RNA polymerase sigma factor [Lachnospiraceae bacterium]MCI9646263.1 RNA polymerase sigma factor [Lachnospiraceae bacterium]
MEEFMQYYEKVYPQLYRTALFYMQNQQEAEDAVQDAVLAAYEKFHQLRDREKFAPWIMQILVNRCRRRMKTWFRREKDIDGISPSQEVELSSEPDFATASAVKQVFWELKEEERMIVALSVFGGYTSEEVAGILGRNHSTVRSKYRRALQKMRKKLEV